MLLLTGFYYVAQASSEVLILPPQPPKCWSCRHEPLSHHSCMASLWDGAHRCAPERHHCHLETIPIPWEWEWVFYLPRGKCRCPSLLTVCFMSESYSVSRFLIGLFHLAQCLRVHQCFQCFSLLNGCRNLCNPLHAEPSKDRAHSGR